MPHLRSYQFALWLTYFGTVLYGSVRELRFLITLLALIVGSIRNLGLPLAWDSRRDDFIDWVVAMLIQDQIQLTVLLSISYPTESTFCEAIFFIQGLLIISWIACDEENNVTNPIFFGGQKLVDFLRENGGLRQLNDMHGENWEFRHFLELYMPLAFISLMPAQFWTKLRSLIFWFSFFPFRYITSVTTQQLVTWHDL